MKPILLTLALMMIFTLAPWADDFVLVKAADPDCASETDKVPCLAEKRDPMAMYMMGRRAYDAGRKSGDLTEALVWAFKVVKVNQRIGNQMLKMLYLQMGGGVHRDFVQAYLWISEAIASDEKYGYLVPWRKRLAAKMSPEQLEQATRLAAD